MKNCHNKAFELKINSLKASLKTKEREYKYLEDWKKKLQEDLKSSQNVDMKATINHFSKIKVDLEEILKRKDQTPTQSTQEPVNISLLISTLKNITSRYQGKVFPILILLNSFWEYVLYYERKIEEYKDIFLFKEQSYKDVYIKCRCYQDHEPKRYFIYRY